MNTPQLQMETLTAINDEVKQLHPLLKRLLAGFPRVQHVEYTHGTGEMGTDFVFSRLEEIFHEMEYVGVIAKLGEVGQDYSDIERQIRECEIERFFNNGKKKIYLALHYAGAFPDEIEAAIEDGRTCDFTRLARAMPALERIEVPAEVVTGR